MRTLIFTLLSLSIGILSGCQAQIHHARTAQVTITGNCGMCEETIERAAFAKGEAMADWDQNTKRATLTYDSTRTNVDALLQRIAQAGYDNERYLAPDAAYASLPECCRYERTFKKAPVATAHTTASEEATKPTDEQVTTAPTAADPLSTVHDAYFLLKDALVATDATQARDHARRLQAAIKAVDMSQLSHDVHIVWMEVMGDLDRACTEVIAAKDIEGMRKAFMTLTGPMMKLVKVSPPTLPVYLDHCPMYEGGADWLSREKSIRNPFYGSQMMTCGSVKETISK